MALRKSAGTDQYYSDDDIYPNLSEMLDLTVVEDVPSSTNFSFGDALSFFCSRCNKGFKNLETLRYHERNEKCTKPRKGTFMIYDSFVFDIL